MMKIKDKILAKLGRCAYNSGSLEKGYEVVRIAICDDESLFRSKLSSAIGTYAELPEDAQVEEFADGQSLVESHEKCPFDIIFLDVEMDGISGMEAGQKIRSNDRNVIIIMVTSHRNYMQQSFKIEIFDYITKPYSDGDIHDVLNRALKKYRDQHHKVVLTWNDNTYALDIGDIVYITTENRQLKFVTLKNVYKCIGKLDHYENKLSPYGFFRCHKSFLVNMDYVRSIEDKMIVTELGDDVYISIRRKKECFDAFSDYVTKYRA